MGCLVVFEGMKAVPRPCVKGDQTLLKGSTPFKKGLTTLLASQYAVLTIQLNRAHHLWVYSYSLKFSRLKIFVDFWGQSKAVKIFSCKIQVHNRCKEAWSRKFAFEQNLEKTLNIYPLKSLGYMVYHAFLISTFEHDIVDIINDYCTTESLRKGPNFVVNC